MEKSAFELLSGMEHSWWYRGRAAMVRSALARTGTRMLEDALDFGAGFGGMHDELSQIALRVYAFEPNIDAKRAAERRGYAQVFSSESEALGRKYNLIGLFDVVEHIEHDGEFLMRAHKALQDGGYLAITVPAFQFLWGIHDINHHHFRRYTKTSMHDVLHQAGFNVEYSSYWNMTLFIPAAFMRLIGKSGEGALALPRWLDEILFTVVKIEALFMRWFPLPFGTSLVIIARKK